MIRDAFNHEMRDYIGEREIEISGEIMKMSSSSATDCQKPKNNKSKNKSPLGPQKRRDCFRHGRESLGREIPFDTPLFILFYYNPQDTKI